MLGLPPRAWARACCCCSCCCCVGVNLLKRAKPSARRVATSGKYAPFRGVAAQAAGHVVAGLLCCGHLVLLLGLLLLNLLLHLLFLGRGHLRERGAGRARDRHMRRRLLRLRRLVVPLLLVVRRRRRKRRKRRKRRRRSRTMTWCVSHCFIY